VTDILKFNRSTSKAVFRHQFKTMAKHNGWAPGDKTAYLIAAFNEPGALILHNVPTGGKCKEMTAVFENRYGDHHLAEEFQAQLRRRVQHAGESQQKFCLHRPLGPPSLCRLDGTTH
jgi:hypothetical protein